MSDDDDTLSRARAQADGVAAENAGIQAGVSNVGRPPLKGPTREDVVRKFVDHGLDAYGEVMDHLVEGGSKAVRRSVGAATGLPGHILDIVDIAKAKDWKREASKKGAGALGGAALGTLAGGPVGGIILGAAGSEGGELGGGYLYDRRDDIARAGRHAINEAQQVGRTIGDTVQAGRDPSSFRWRAFNHH